MVETRIGGLTPKTKAHPHEPLQIDEDPAKAPSRREGGDDSKNFFSINAALK